jgi:hypothetical protein
MSHKKWLFFLGCFATITAHAQNDPLTVTGVSDRTNRYDLISFMVPSLAGYTYQVLLDTNPIPRAEHTPNAYRQRDGEQSPDPIQRAVDRAFGYRDRASAMDPLRDDSIGGG